MLTDKQERFAQCIALEGMNNTDAYKECYNTENMKDTSIWDCASKLRSNTEVAHRIDELKAQVVSPKIMTAIQRKEKLTEHANNEDPNVSMKAIDLLNKMDGEYVQRIEADVNQDVVVVIDLVDD